MGRLCKTMNGLWERSTDWFRDSSEGCRCILAFILSALFFIFVEGLMHWMTGGYTWLESYVDYYGAIAGSILALMGTTATGYIFLIEYSRLSELRSSSPWMMMKTEMKSVFRWLVTISVLTIIVNTVVAFREVEGLAESCILLAISGLFVGLVGAFLIFDYDMVTADTRLERSLRRFLKNIQRELKIEKGDGIKSGCSEGVGKAKEREGSGSISDSCRLFGEIENLFYDVIGLPKDEVMLEEYNGGRHTIPPDDDEGYEDEAKLRKKFIRLRRVRDIGLFTRLSGL